MPLASLFQLPLDRVSKGKSMVIDARAASLLPQYARLTAHDLSFACVPREPWITPHLLSTLLHTYISRTDDSQPRF